MYKKYEYVSECSICIDLIIIAPLIVIMIFLRSLLIFSFPCIKILKFFKIHCSMFELFYILLKT